MRSLTKKEVAALRLQMLLSWLTFPVFGTGAVLYMRLIRRNRVPDLEPIRLSYREITERGRPTVVCANHLTMVDSIFLHHALCSLPGYMLRPRLFSWNVPAIENFKRSLGLSVLTYLGKTVPIDRAGSPEHHAKVLEKLRWLLSEGQVVTIFPEGGRSRTGRVDPESVTYGVGNILKDFPEAIVICAYLRGERQESWGELPAKGDVLRLDIAEFKPAVEGKGLRAARSIARQVIGKLKEMEDRRLGAERATPPGSVPSTTNGAKGAPGLARDPSS